MLPTSLGLLLPAFGPARKGAAIGLWSAVGGAAAAFGPPIGGLLVQINWRWVFLVNLPFSLVALVVGVRVLREIKDPVAHKADLLGAAFLSVAVASLAAAIVEGSNWGWTSPSILGAFTLAVLASVALVVRSGRHPNPIIEPAVIRHRAVALADASSLVFFAGFGAMVLGGVLFLTGVWHEQVLRAGFMIAPGPLIAAISAFPGGLLGSRFSHRAVGTVGSLLFAGSAVWWITRIGVTPDYVGAYLPGSLLGGIGVGLMLPSLGGAATAPLPPERAATGTALYAMCRQIGLALGVSCLVAVLGTATGLDAVHAFHHAWIFMAACSLTAGPSCRESPARRRSGGRASRSSSKSGRYWRWRPVNNGRPSRATGSVPGKSNARGLAMSFYGPQAPALMPYLWLTHPLLPSSRYRRKAARRSAAGRLTNSIVGWRGVNHRARKGSTGHSCPASPAAPPDDPSSRGERGGKIPAPGHPEAYPLVKVTTNPRGEPNYVSSSGAHILCETQRANGDPRGATCALQSQGAAGSS